MDDANERKRGSYDGDVSVMSEKRAKIDDTETYAVQKPQKAQKAKELLSLLDVPKECMQNVLSFLNLKNGMALRGTCRQLRFCEKEDGNKDDNVDMFQYCRLHTTGPGISRRHPSWITQHRIIQSACQNVSAVEALLANKTCLPEDERVWAPVDAIISKLIDADNEQGLAVLIEKGYMLPNPQRLVYAIHSRRRAVASVLEAFLFKKKEQNDQIEICNTCHDNVAVLSCSDKCDSSGKLCRSCVLKMEHSCHCCYSFLCSDCHGSALFSGTREYERCHVCGKNVCRSGKCDRNCKECHALICRSCQDELEGQSKGRLCPDCLLE